MSPILIGAIAFGILVGFVILLVIISRKQAPKKK